MESYEPGAPNCLDLKSNQEMLGNKQCAPRTGSHSHKVEQSNECYTTAPNRQRRCVITDCPATINNMYRNSSPRVMVSNLIVYCRDSVEAIRSVLI